MNRLMNVSRMALAAVAGAALLAVGLPVTAAHASDLPVIQQARSDFDGDLGTLLVTVSAPLGVASLHAELTSFATGEEVATTDDFVLRSGTPEAGVWATAQPFLLDQLGNFRVHVEVTDNAGNHVRRDNAGTLAYLVRTSFEQVALDRTTVTYEERDVTVSGVLTGRWPGTGEIRPAPGLPIFISAFFDFKVATTGADGAFSGTVTITQENDSVFAQFLHDNNNPFFLASNTGFLKIAIEPRQTRVGISTRPHRVDLGETTTVRGKLEWKTPEGWQPIPDEVVGVLSCTPIFCGGVAGRPVTGADGGYELVAEPFQTGHYQAGYVAIDPFFGLPDPFVARAVATADIAVLQPARFTTFTATRDGSGTVLVEGHLRFGNFTPGTIPVEIQFSRSGIEGWLTVDTVNAEWDGTGEHFVLEVDRPMPGHWRARYPGVHDFFQSATSPTVFVP